MCEERAAPATDRREIAQIRDHRIRLAAELDGTEMVVREAKPCVVAEHPAARPCGAVICREGAGQHEQRLVAAAQVLDPAQTPFGRRGGAADHLQRVCAALVR